MVQVQSHVGSGGWANELGTRLHWMANAGLGSASLRLTPEQLGPVEVKISVHQNAASVWFSASQPDTRSALEQALPRLKELFSAQGLNLAQAGVSDQSARSAPEQRHGSSASPRASAARELSATSVTSAVRSHQGLIDTYA
jgi:flagellar hook-length control protein FliK